MQSTDQNGNESLDEIGRRLFYVMIREFNDYMNKVLRVPNAMKMYKDSSEVSPPEQERSNNTRR